MLTFATMKFRTVIYTLLLATLCMGCGGSLSMRQLEQLEARMNDAPDSVLAVLTAADIDEDFPTLFYDRDNNGNRWGEIHDMQFVYDYIYKMVY